MNMASLVKVGGVILHENPFNAGNHGFYGFNPTLYHDFYKQNGFELLDCRLICQGKHHYPPQTGRFKFGGEETAVFVIAQRKEVQKFQFPTQTKYLRMNESA
jgi:hypothetical protein